MKINTKIFGEIEIADDRIISFPSGIIGFPELTEFALLHDEDSGSGAMHWMQSLQEPAFAMPVINPLLVMPDYNPVVEDELIKPIGELLPEEILVMVTVTVPSDLTKMSVNLKGPIVEGEQYPVKFPVYDILNAKKAGE